MFLNKKSCTQFELSTLNSQLYYSQEYKFVVIKNKKLYSKVIYIPFFIFVRKKANFFYFTNIFQNLFSENFDSFYRLLSNLAASFNKIIRKKIILKGLGLRIYYNRVLNILKLKLGFSHLILLAIPKTIKIFKSKSFLLLESYDLVRIGNFSRILRKFKYPNSYTGKGIWFKNEFIKLKPVKKN